MAASIHYIKHGYVTYCDKKGSLHRPLRMTNEIDKVTCKKCLKKMKEEPDEG